LGEGFQLQSAVGVFLVVFGWITLSHAGPLNPPKTSNYFHSDLLSQTSFSGQQMALCDGRCSRKKKQLAKGRKKKGYHRKVSNAVEDPSTPKLNSDYFLGILTDAKYTLLSPLGWKGSDWLKASLVLGTTGVFFALDDEIQNFAQDKRSSSTDSVASAFEPFGNGAYTLPGLVAFYTYGHFAKNKKAKRVALLAVESFAVTGVFNLALKFSTGRTRPQSAKNSRQWNGFSSSDNSFASGHTSSIFAVATIVASEYKNNPWVPPVAYGIATLTGLSRINDNKHWASDVFFGGALGYFVSKTILKLHSNKKGRHYTIYPRISRKEVGLDFAMRF